VILECANCGTQYPGDLAKQWGRTKETTGYGAQMCCVALVPNGLKAPDGSEAQEVCRGTLGALADAAIVAGRMTALNAIPTLGSRI